MAELDFVFTSRTEPLDLELTVDGTLPSSLAGTFYGMTAGGTRVGSTPLSLLDAHGRVVAIRIGEGRASLRARMVDTPLWQAERAAQAIVKRRIFTNKPSRWSNLLDVELANPASHNVGRWGKHLVAMNDPGFFLLDPDTLETRGPAPLVPAKGATFTPMPRRDPQTGRHVVFETRPGRRDTIVVRELDDELAVASEHAYRLDRGAAFFHDVTFSPRYYVIVQWSSVSVPALLWGARPAMEALRFDPDATPRIHLLPRDGGAPISLPLPGGRTHFHFWNAFEADGKLVVDAIGYAGQVGFQSIAPRERYATPAPTPASASWRYTIDVAARTVRDEQLADHVIEGPAIHPERRGRPYRLGWAASRGTHGDAVRDPNGAVWFHALVRHDFEARSSQLWDAGPHAFVSFPEVVPQRLGGAEDEAHVLAFVQDIAAETTSVAVFDARDLGAGPVARLTAPGLIGAVSHVAFAAT
jgi:carotenoid cleavage dioxygenase-like enzyme